MVSATITGPKCCVDAIIVHQPVLSNMTEASDAYIYMTGEIKMIAEE